MVSEIRRMGSEKCLTEHPAFFIQGVLPQSLGVGQAPNPYMSCFLDRDSIVWSVRGGAVSGAAGGVRSD